MSKPLVLDGGPLSIADVASVARHGRRITIGPTAKAQMAAARRVVESAATGDLAVYGINTGFGSLAHRRIAPDDVRAVQANLIRSHAAGVGDPLPVDVVRAMLVILGGSLARGRSGTHVDVLEQIVALLNNDITPVVPSRGSVGASGDLAPLAHVALVLIGEGEASTGAERESGDAALRAAGLAPLVLQAKEGLALINGTHLMAAIATLGLDDLDRLVPTALGAAALAIDACRASDGPLDPRLHAARRQRGQERVAESLRNLLAGSAIVASHKEGDPRVQDPYCLRATPQVLGAVLDTVEHARTIVERELGAVTDNPLVFADDEAILSGGNFHGMPLAIALDVLAIALAHLAGISERRTFWVMKAADEENPVHPYLSPDPGLHSGFMITQYTAAACCNELQTLATPASVANIPTAAGMEDYNSMGATAAHELRAAISRASEVIAIELLVMAEAIEYQRPLRSGAGVESILECVRAVVPRLTADRPPAPDIAAALTLIEAGTVADIVRTPRKLRACLTGQESPNRYEQFNGCHRAIVAPVGSAHTEKRPMFGTSVGGMCTVAPSAGGACVAIVETPKEG